MSPPTKRLSQPEFIALIAMLFATVAFSIDAMLPAMPQIGAELSPDAPNLAQLIILGFVFGMGAGTLFAGPLSDRFGRKPVILSGAALYIFGAGLAYVAPTLEMAVAARVIQGLGAAGPRAVAIAIVRDLYAGRTMAKIMSFAMTIFSLIPAAAPLLGEVIIDASSWRGIFLAFIVFSLISAGWLAIRQPETLPPERRRPLDARALWAGTVEILSSRTTVLSILTLTICFAMLFSVLVSTQPIFDITFGRGDSFAEWFALMAVLSMSGSIINARLVERLGMRFMVTTTMGFMILGTGTMTLVTALEVLTGDAAFYAFFAWATSVFFMAGLTMGNLNALAMEPLGHIAGLAASVVSSIATVLSILLAAPIGQAFDGTPLPVAIGVLILACAGFVIMLFNRAQGPRAAVTQA